ncbi:carboxymuconolactone decarboxylase family protein [Oxalobacteraceae bacterium OM1]|nr:carboxymuconolactone decarboxylase family protein [Oxalobacteraceae bacterium OM1]
MSDRIAPLEAPYEPAVAEAFSRVMPPGRAPLTLFRTMARNPRVLQRMFAGSLLDKGTLTLRQRELVILWTTACCGSEYEWGVHVSFFAQRAGLADTDVAATCAAPGAHPWPPADAALLRLCDALHNACAIDDALWQALREHYSEEQLLEAIALAGYYHTISFLTNGLRLPLEPDAARFPAHQ